MAKDVIVRLQALDGVWEVGGIDRKRGIGVENPQPTSDLWGPAGFSFEMRRDPRAIWPDLGAFTPVDVEIAGKLCWSGWISETPSRDSADRVIGVQCLGGQSHLDDDVYERAYVHSAISDWRDARTFLAADLTLFTAAQGVNTDNGVVVLSLPRNQLISGGSVAAIVLDLGPYSTAGGISVDYTSSNNSAVAQLYVRSNDTPGTIFGPNAATIAGTPVTNNTGASGTVSGAFSVANRYVLIFLYLNAADTTPGADVWFKITGVRVFSDDTYRSSAASVLKASTVVTDALSRATVRLNSDRSLIQATSFPIPDLVLTEPKTPREVWTAINAYHDWLTQIDAQKRPVFKPKPTAPTLEVGAWSPLELEDQSANSGEEIYNRVIVVGAQPDGSPLRVERTAAQQPGVIYLPVSGPAPDNPSFDTNTASWSGSTGVTITRDTGTFDTAPAAGRFDAPSGGGNVTETFSGTFKRGVTYNLQFIWRGSMGIQHACAFGVTGDASQRVISSAAGAFQLDSITWTPTADRTGVRLVIGSFTFGLATGGDLASTLGPVYFDSLRLLYSAPTLVDRRGFIRTKTLPVQAALTVAAAQTVGDLWLAAHKTTPYKGTFKITGDRAVRDPATGRYVPLEDLLLRTGELIRDTNAIDPDTGGVGRDGRIAAVSYNPAAEEATVTLDNSRASFEALLERLAVITGSN